MKAQGPIKPCQAFGDNLGAATKMGVVMVDIAIILFDRIRLEFYW